MRYVLFLSILSLLTASVFSQEQKNAVSYPVSDFRSPLDINLALSSSFGEIRSNHLHSGLDIRTNQHEGYPVYAVADGFISRLRVQIGGFGNALYVSHPNGYTSVYAHLQRFNPQIAQKVKQIQYSNQSYPVDSLLIATEIPVKKGEIIAWSGNTGGSAGPHLHFEIRDSKTEEIINPQLFGIEIPDRIKPVIRGVYAYKLDGLPFSEKTTKQYFEVSGSDGKYSINRSEPLLINVETGFGLKASDQIGIYSIELKVDQKTIYTSALERFYFDHTQAANSYIDYPAYISSGSIIYKTFIEPGNPLMIYQKTSNYGLIKPYDNNIHQLEYIVNDVKGNTSVLSFKVKYGTPAIAGKIKPISQKTFFYNQLNEFQAENIKMVFPKGSLYSDLNFAYSESARPAGAYSASHVIHSRLVPLNNPFELLIKPDSRLPAELIEKALIRDSRGRSYITTFENGYLKAMPGGFGSFYITIDTVAPIIRPVNITQGKSMAGVSKMTFKISDNLSGIKSFRGFVDGKWILMEYDQKTATLWHTFDERTSSGSHAFELEVTDNKLNTKTYKLTFYR